MPASRSPVGDVLADLDALFRHLDLRWYLFGAQAAILYGSTRVTADVDVTVDLADARPADLVRRLPGAGFSPRVRLDARFVAASRVLPVDHVATGLPVDIVLAGPGLEEVILDRVHKVRIAKMQVPVVSPEDLIVLKLLASRPQDLMDIESLLRGGVPLDMDELRDTLRALEEAIGHSDLLPRLDALVSSTGKHPPAARKPKPRRPAR